MVVVLIVLLDVSVQNQNVLWLKPKVVGVLLMSLDVTSALFPCGIAIQFHRSSVDSTQN